MDFSKQHTYEADAARVFAMLTDPAFLEGMASNDGVLEHQVSVDGAHTIVRAAIAAPDMVRRFVGPQMQVRMDTDWTATTPQGGHTGPLTVSVAKMPAKLTATATITPDGPRAVVSYAGEFSVGIPVVGRKLEQMAAPYITFMLDAQWMAGQAWLKEHPAA
ncbi:MAG: DUF2505 domain-containing protein [Actinomycetia bacterium]|nr:DUF2505 domain-containing protein [Actinomycetes bacterium]